MEAAKQCLAMRDQRVYGKEGWMKATSPIRRLDSSVVRWTYNDGTLWRKNKVRNRIRVALHLGK